MRVAVAGVNGIGKHHAKWHYLAGAEVVAFLGSSEDTCAKGTQALCDIFPFSGRSYSDFDELLEREQPDVVDICLPNELHYAHALKALENGCHVLCEKPLVWDGQEPAHMLFQAQELVEYARGKGLRLGVCSQYAAALPHYARLHQARHGHVQRPHAFYAEMDTLARGRTRSAEEIWIDMGPHPLSLLLAWMPQGVVHTDSLDVAFSAGEARARFDFSNAEHVCQCEVIVRDLAAGKPVRRFGINDVVVDCEGRADETGAYRCVLSEGSMEEIGDDFMSLHIAQFLACVEDPALALLASGEMGLRNLELQLQVLQRA